MTGSHDDDHTPRTGGLPLTASLEETSGPTDVVHFLSMAPFVSGEQPWALRKRLYRLVPDVLPIPAGATVRRQVSEYHHTAILATGPGYTVRSIVWGNGCGEVTVLAVTEQKAQRTLAEITERAESPATQDETSVDLGFWYHASHGPVRQERTIAAPEWTTIAANYATDTAQALRGLIDITPADISGRLILLHGPPGTGKTTALRSLARHWRDWSRIDCVLDPETFFANPAYLMEVVIGEDGHPHRPVPDPKWRLLIIEDCDELIRGEAKASTGQALARLLNLTDGLLGQGRDVLVAITTNERLDRLHPAVVRPGRCLAQIEVGALSAQQSTSWLGGGEHVYQPMTLAELYAARSGGGPTISVRDTTSPGQYL
jgi:SpoVK/Ycf46/Vps4 family AAA+-type ATPase